MTLESKIEDCSEKDDVSTVVFGKEESFDCKQAATRRSLCFPVLSALKHKQIFHNLNSQG